MVTSRGKKVSSSHTATKVAVTQTLFDLHSPSSAFSESTILPEYAMQYQSDVVGASRIIHANCFDWLKDIPENSLHAIITDPPYGVKEYELDQLEKKDSGIGGVWRIPPSFDGHIRSPVPRFTALNEKERQVIRTFFKDWSRYVMHALRPGGHIFLASNTFLSQLVFSAIVESGLEFRGELIRLVRTLRGGDRPKNAELEFPDVCTLPRGCYEPWGIFRKPLLPKMTVSDCLREYQTGGLRRRVETSVIIFRQTWTWMDI